MKETAIFLNPTDTELENRRRAQLMHQILVTIGATDFYYDPELQCYVVPESIARQVEAIYVKCRVILEWKHADCLIDVLQESGLLPQRPMYNLTPTRIHVPYRKVV